MAISDPPKPRIVDSAAEVAEKILFAKPEGGGLGKVIFFIGAGCSVTADIADATGVAKRMAQEAAKRLRCSAEGADCLAAYRALIENKYITDACQGIPIAEQTIEKIDWFRIYDEMFRRHYATHDDARELFNTIVEEGKGAVNWSHLCLGELVARGYISTVLTTNFDQLVMTGMVMAGIIPVVSDGLESLNRIAAAPTHPQLVELHGSRHTYKLRNRPEDVRELLENAQASANVQKLFQYATTFVVVGYGGREDGIMDLLIQAAEAYTDKNLYWVQYSSDPEAISPKARQFLGTSRNGGLLINQDADEFFMQLCRLLKVGTPAVLSDPLSSVRRIIGQFNIDRVANADIRAELENAKTRVNDIDELFADASRKKQDVASHIRELRLAGKFVEAYEVAERALARAVNQ